MRNLALLVVGLLAVSALPSAASSRPPAGRVIRVDDDRSFAAAVAALLDSGGTVVLLPHRYVWLTVPARPRGSGRLAVVGSARARVGRLLLTRTSHVSIRGVTIAPTTGDASLEVRDSSAIDVDRILVTARGTPYSASVTLPGSRGVTIRRSTFTHCGDRSPTWANCVFLAHEPSGVVIEDSWFHDCYGCDFIHGSAGTGLVVRRNRLERSLPCDLGLPRCGHQDLIELFAGRRLTFDSNVFGVYRLGGAQLYLTGPMDHVTVVNNLFVGSDPRIPGYRARVGLIVGSKSRKPPPQHVLVANNTILTGARRVDGYAGSLRMTSAYARLPRSVRPILANNVIGLLESRWPVCGAVRTSASNVVVRGQRCSRLDRTGNPMLDASGRPTRRSTLLVDRASPRYAPRLDASGRPRDAKPDIGAFEYRTGR